jgi:hypothetical protein
MDQTHTDPEPGIGLMKCPEQSEGGFISSQAILLIIRKNWNPPIGQFFKITKKLFMESNGLSHIVSFTNRSVFDQIARFQNDVLT